MWRRNEGSTEKDVTLEAGIVELLALSEAEEEEPSEPILSAFYSKLVDCTWVRTKAENADATMKTIGFGYMVRKLALNAPAHLKLSRHEMELTADLSMGTFLELPSSKYVIGGKPTTVSALGRVSDERILVKRGVVVSQARCYLNEEDHGKGKIAYHMLSRSQVSEDGNEMVREELCACAPFSSPP